MIFIGDVAGQFGALKRLVDRVSIEEPICLLGDLVDRGPQSKEVIEFAMTDPRIVCSLLGNHEHMMLDWVHGPEIYSYDIWLGNGGGATLLSYGTPVEEPNPLAKKRIPQEHLAWLAKRPKMFWVAERDEKGEEIRCLATHAPVHKSFLQKEIDEVGFTKNTEMMLDDSILWNRSMPVRRPFFQVFGHNSHWGYQILKDEKGPWGACLDSSRARRLTAMHWPSLEVWQEPYDVVKMDRGRYPDQGAGF